MLGIPEHGWVTIEINDGAECFIGHASYLTNVPVDLLDMFIDHYTKQTGVAWFDEEGTEFTIVLNPYSIFVIEEKIITSLHEFKLDVSEIAREVIKDIKSNINGWINWLPEDEPEDIARQHNELLTKISKLEELIERRK